MVGSTSKQLESSVCKSVTHPDPLEEDISQYLLLHHDYAAKPESEPKRIRRKKLKEIKPKSQQSVVTPTVQTTDQQDVL